MPGYLDNYGAGEERRNRLIFRSVVSVIIVVVVAILSWYLLKNRRQEGVVKAFLGDVRRGDMTAAYRDWGCTSAKPCSGYDYQKFVGDWGPPSSGAHDPPDSAILGLIDSESCNDGVLLTVEVNRARTEKLWVDKSADSINYAPYPICPHKSPFSIMVHRTLGRLRKPLLK